MQAIDHQKGKICQGARMICLLNPDLGLVPIACMSIDAGGFALDLSLYNPDPVRDLSKK